MRFLRQKCRQIGSAEILCESWVNFLLNFISNSIVSISLATLLGIGSTLGAVSCGRLGTPPPIELDRGAFESLNDFSAELWAKTASDRNSVISPISAYYALAMCAGGAKGSTKEAFAALGLDDENAEKSINALRELTDVLLSKRGSTKLLLSNSAWISDSFTVSKDYAAQLKKLYNAEIFSEDLPSSVGKINAWIEKATNKMIRGMVDSISPETMLMLINTIYMKSKWLDKFDESSTRLLDFHLASGETEQIDFMKLTNDMRVVELEGNDGYLGVVLPYDDDRLEFIAIMPNDEGKSTSDFIGTLTGERAIGHIAETGISQKVKLSLPKFEIENSINLNDVLIALGMDEIFRDTADFSGMLEEGVGLCVDSVLQNAKIIVDESGTEAAAVTIVSIKLTSLAPDTIREISFDRPFVWAVIEKHTGVPLFCGEFCG